MRTRLLMSFALLVAVASSSCSTIYFNNGPGRGTEIENSEWHHDGIFRLVEFSDPVDLNARCEGKTWDTVMTEETFVQGLVRGLTYGLYDPWDVNYLCKQ